EDFAFFPEEIAFLAAGETRTVDVIVTIPIGQHEGLYSGYIQVVSENGGEDQVLVTIDICDKYDLDIRDNYANLSGNVMEVSCTARANQSGGEWALRAFDIGLPDEVANNYDDFDGPGNAPISCVTYEFDEWSFMWQNDDQGHNYHYDKRFTGEGSVEGELFDWSSGEFRRLLVAIYVPPMVGNDNHPGTYKGGLTCRADVGADEVVYDSFDIEIHLSRAVGHEPTLASEFGGYPDGGGARLYWGRFDEIGLTGAINLYREDDVTGLYTRINSTPLGASSDFLDTEIEAGTEYNYKLGIGYQDSEFFIGPVAVGGAPKSHHLSQNAPNPFRNGTSISYQLPSLTHVSLRVYDVSGRLVRILKEGEEPAGFYTAMWDRKDERGREVASGVYFYRYVTPLFEETRKMVVLH
ncbi:MAG: T9SS type A sorting domain-containing protein, partial [Candidatus Eisenbacteria sp.]|nr:T9SS type A sorting domain-containing protein [Candidatus Eisenbacteria bacterium]